ncbi:MAG: PEP/pyruvate-binding domain-containing protein [Galactobacter sp.]|uniref:PEP/pyruvate-binding domain-containing protein n=1 Tax=Galactobacter sp. TaxID=2676125 RepID=UPI0025B9042A|nr:PEP/pyruvate-binding domain-containing protein [Galactobacter sp.]
MNLIVDFKDPSATELWVSGGKGASLAKSARDLPVPGGLIVTADAYARFVGPLKEHIAALAEGEEPAEAIAELIRTTELPQGWAEEIEAAMQAIGLIDRPVAVRSSGTMEDLPGAAFAGQHDTYLGVRGPQAVAEAVRDCYASLWNNHAYAYREQLGVDHLEAKMAVVVQLMVSVGADEAAGVAFSVDPVRGNTDEVLINAAFGLGETVVGGEEPVDEYRVRRDDGNVVASEIAAKRTALVMREAVDGGAWTGLVQLSAAQGTRSSLTPEQAGRVAELALAAENHFGFPQDIEWAFSGDALYLLQSRPITRVAARWTRDESAERFPTPITPLTWDLVEAGFHHSLNHSFDLMGLPPFHDKWFAMKDFYIYGNQTAVDLYAGRLPTNLLSSVETITESLPQIAAQFGWVQELPGRWMRDLDTYLLGIGRLSNEPLESKTLGQLWDHVIAISDLGTEYFLSNIAISLTQRTLYGALQHMLSLALDAEQAQVVFERLLASTETKTSQVNAELRELAEVIADDASLLDVLEANPGEAGVAALTRFPAFEREFSAFLSRHGHRELDFDAYHPTWVEAPHIVLDQLRLLALHSVETDEGGEASESARADLKRKVVQAETERAVVNAAPEKLRYLVQEVIRLARTYTALDDLEHYQTTRLTLPLRRALKELGSRLVSAGVLAEVMDVYFIPFKDLDAAIRTGSLEPLGEVAARNKAGYQEAVARTPDWNHGVQAVPDDLDSEGVIRGTAGSPGEVSGEVFVVHSPEDFSSFPEGAILIARTTNPAWTALFYQASGVVTESGGALSHGAVTARELGLPAVMAVRNATSRFSNGQRVKVNGSTGVITEE